MYMNNINNKKLNISIFALAILVIFASFNTNKAEAAYLNSGYYLNSNSSNNTNQNSNNNNYNQYNDPYYYNQNNNGYSNGEPRTVVYNIYNTTTTTAPAKTTATSTPKKQVAKSTTTKKAAAVKNTNQSSKDSLTANALSSSNDFLPSSLLGWLFIFFLVFLIVFMARKIYKVNEAPAPKLA